MTTPAKRILVVDDQEENLYLLRVLLSSHGYEVLEARSGEQAMERLRETACDLVLLDVMMPGMDGYEVCRNIRQEEPLSHLPVILLTAKRDVDSKVQGLDVGASDYITKPFDRQEVLARIRSLLSIEALKQKLVEAERLAAIGQLAVTLNHEINSPLAAISGNAELLARQLKDAPGDVRDKLDTIHQQAMRISEILAKVRRLRQATPTPYLEDTQMIDLNASKASGGDRDPTG